MARDTATGVAAIAAATSLRIGLSTSEFEPTTAMPAVRIAVRSETALWMLIAFCHERVIAEPGSVMKGDLPWTSKYENGRRRPVEAPPSTPSTES